MPDLRYGVLLNELRCPTCGSHFRDYKLHTEMEPFAVQQSFGPIKTAGVGRKFLLCPDGHRWTVVMIWRQIGYPDRVQLGIYIGTE